ncbi:enoyl-CoA hydratase/isomerase family protein [Roseiterribacter gracilis]|uniref:Enoyl-CoA hydratase n=1 Tax=Roseiterribacter gracilis TaxID=2812848 RepID=A0A8S8X9A9_9PROT|nr:enoyl-CoA hydratase [Rhodospirillales bacterium TMPK1]
MNSSDPVLVERQGAVAIVSLNRPAVLNALSLAMADALGTVMPALAVDPTVRAVLLVGAGDHFMAGGDLVEMRKGITAIEGKEAQKAETERWVHRAHVAIRAIASMPKPVITAVHGSCAGYGISLMLASDLALAADGTKFTLAYCAIGTSPDGGATWTLPRAIGAKAAAELALTGDRFDAARAMSLGLINRVVAPDKLRDDALALATRLAAGPTAALARTKTLLREGMARSLDAQLDEEARNFAASAVSDDFAEGIDAFLNKRMPKFEGR